MRNSFRDRVASKLAAGKPIVAYEVGSPCGSNAKPYLKKIAKLGLKGKVDALNVFDNPTSRVRIDPMAYGSLLKEASGIDVVVHAKTRDMTFKKFTSWLYGLDALRLQNILIMSGDPPHVGDYPTEASLENLNPLEANTGVKHFLNEGCLMPDAPTKQARGVNRFQNKPRKAENSTNFYIGNVILPLRKSEARYTVQKLAAGADFFQTQITYDVPSTLKFFKALAVESRKRKVNFEAPILVGTAPIKSGEQAVTFGSRIPYVLVPPDLVDDLAGEADPLKASVRACIDFYATLNEGLEKAGLAFNVGYHVMALGADEAAKSIIKGVRKLK